MRVTNYILCWVTITITALIPDIAFGDMVNAIAKIKPSIVVVGTYKKTDSPQFVLKGTGFVVGGGNLIATNSHVIPEADSPEAPALVIQARLTDGSHQVRRARLLVRDPEHDLAIIRVDGPPLPALELKNSDLVREGEIVAFTGFPIGGILGFSPVTHRGMISAITPIAIPSGNVRQLKEQSIRQIKRGVFDIFQLDATAYPGNSGSPLFELESGSVIGVMNMVFIKGSKESALSTPSGISYAIPANYLKALLAEQVKSGNNP